MISETHISAQKPRGSHLNAKVCDSKSAIFLLCSDHFVKERYLENGSSSHRHFITKLILITARSFKTTQGLHSYKFILVDKTVLSSTRFCLLRRTPFSNVVRMRTRSFVPKPKTTVIGLGARLVHVKSRVEYGWPCWHDLFPY